MDTSDELDQLQVNNLSMTAHDLTQFIAEHSGPKHTYHEREGGRNQQVPMQQPGTSQRRSEPVGPTILLDLRK